MPGATAVILAAGQGKRMRSDLVKVLHPVAGRTMVDRVLSAAEGAGLKSPVVVIGVQGDRVKEVLGDRARYAAQDEQLGTGHAVMQASGFLDPDDDLVVMYGDCPLLTPDILTSLLDHHRETGAFATVLTAVLSDPTGYGRIIRGAGGELEAIREHRDAGPEELSIREINTGMGAFRAGPLLEILPTLGRDNAAGEYYLVDAVAALRAGGKKVVALEAAEPEAVLGVNTRVQLAGAERVLRDRHLERLMLDGVTVLDPAGTFVDDTVEVGRDTVILPFTMIQGSSRIGSGCTIGPSAHIIDSVIEDGATVRASAVEGSTVGGAASVGPFSHLRPGTRLEERVKVGNFAEIKNSTVGAGSKVPHHSYVGDSTLGAGVNIGAGVVTVNYDGRDKHRTVLDEGAFIGCNANLIAPLTVGRRGFVAAGTTVTGDVPPGALARGRAKQINTENWVVRRFGPEEEKPG